MLDNQQQVIDIASKHLGQAGGVGYSSKYDPKLLVRIPRKLNRESTGIDPDNIPFVGTDVWNAYEVSALTQKGLPVSGMMKIIYSANSEYHVESKSLKLYLNSLNMYKLGKTVADCIESIEYVVHQDLKQLLGESIIVKFFKSPGEIEDEKAPQFPPTRYKKKFKKNDLIKNSKTYSLTTYHLEMIDFSDVDKDTSFESFKRPIPPIFNVHTDLLRSNCRVTGQPDWGDLYVYMEENDDTELTPTVESFLRYVVGQRTVSHFHEEIVEMIFHKLYTEFAPKELLVAALYTRRGGIDINPIRATNPKLIPSVFSNVNKRLKKTLRQ